MFGRMVKTLAAVAVVAAAAGCIDVSTVVKVKKDGSGEIVQTMFLSPALSGMMGGMMGMAGENGQPASLVNEDELKSKCAEMGEGVTFVSGKEVKRTDGAKGVRAVYEFADVTKLKINPMSGMDNAGGGMKMTMEGAAEEPAADKKDESIRFEFTPGDAPKLTLLIPQDDKEAAAGDADAAAEVAKDEPEVIEDAIDVAGGGAAQKEMAKAMMKQMFDGMRIRFYVMVDGEITDTNASYVEEHKSSGKKQFVAVVDMNLGELIKNPEKFDKLSAMGPDTDPEKMKDMLKDFPEVKIETAKRVDISFK